MDSSGRAFGNALLAELALSVVDVSNVVLDGNSLEWTYLRTHTALNTLALVYMSHMVMVK